MKSCFASSFFVALLAIVTMSSPVRIFSWCRNDSLIARLIRFRSTALGATRRDTVTPSRLSCRLLLQAYTTKRASLLLQACAITNWYSVEETSRRLFENRKPGVPAANVDTFSLDAQALRRARPRARRALITARPPRVCILARNPWVRLRLISLGWKVRFIE